MAAEPDHPHPSAEAVALLYLPELVTACQETLDLSARPQTVRRLQVLLLLAQPEGTTRTVLH